MLFCMEILPFVSNGWIQGMFLFQQMLQTKRSLPPTFLWSQFPLSPAAMGMLLTDRITISQTCHLALEPFVLMASSAGGCFPHTTTSHIHPPDRDLLRSTPTSPAPVGASSCLHLTPFLPSSLQLSHWVICVYLPLSLPQMLSSQRQGLSLSFLCSPHA